MYIAIHGSVTAKAENILNSYQQGNLLNKLQHFHTISTELLKNGEVPYTLIWKDLQKDVKKIA